MSWRDSAIVGLIYGTVTNNNLKQGIVRLSRSNLGADYATTYYVFSNHTYSLWLNPIIQSLLTAS